MKTVNLIGIRLLLSTLADVNLSELSHQELLEWIQSIDEVLSQSFPESATRFRQTLVLRVVEALNSIDWFRLAFTPAIHDEIASLLIHLLKISDTIIPSVLEIIFASCIVWRTQHSSLLLPFKLHLLSIQRVLKEMHSDDDRVMIALRSIAPPTHKNRSHYYPAEYDRSYAELLASLAPQATKADLWIVAYVSHEASQEQRSRQSSEGLKLIFESITSLWWRDSPPHSLALAEIYRLVDHPIFLCRKGAPVSFSVMLSTAASLFMMGPHRAWEHLCSIFSSILGQSPNNLHALPILLHSGLMLRMADLFFGTPLNNPNMNQIAFQSLRPKLYETLVSLQNVSSKKSQVYCMAIFTLLTLSKISVLCHTAISPKDQSIFMSLLKQHPKTAKHVALLLKMHLAATKAIISLIEKTSVPIQSSTEHKRLRESTSIPTNN